MANINNLLVILKPGIFPWYNAYLNSFMDTSISTIF
jgi:hypothetical protein